ncbi:hypothetical protein [Paenibacillus campinasensis]|uniref:Uncharacterized protein n=1 Tax=Paenibacillus campinasensis TaxID=66347 RepID=A0A268ELG4_9BACL|nr:hypothetical protein [Paenibacillus campinasensis]PAD73955.1 hypothetical protein CHH67_19165 [Paenibacillus campinasensis]
MDWNKIVTDLREANAAATAAASAIADGGSANLDAVFLKLPRQREEKVLQAISEAGLYCRGKREWIGSGYMVVPTCGGQGDRRALSVTVMCDELRDRGWRAIPFRKVD